MRKEILITNYNKNIFIEAIKDLNLNDEDFAEYEGFNIEEFNDFINNEENAPMDIFTLFYYYEVIKEINQNKETKKLPSFTSDILYPHEDGLKYQEFIVAHENYRGISYNRNKTGQIGWVATSDTEIGKARVEFWERKRINLRIPGEHVLEAGLRQKVAYANHPSKKHTCLFTGNILSLDYRYVAPSRIDRLNEAYDEQICYYDLDIIELSSYFYEIDKCSKFNHILGISLSNPTLADLQNHLCAEYIAKEKKPYVSPGVMSNSPDRLDGFHSYNADIREIIDSGRSKSNLKKYTQDRRVYEMWADGDWKKADRLYATFVKNGVSPDHIGPMSLGFCHRPKFKPLTQAENSSKGNRMSYADVRELIEDEKNGEQVISWHSQYVWDKLKESILNDVEAKKLSALMRKNLHYVLLIFAEIHKNGFDDFLEPFLNLDYSFFDHQIEGFKPEDGTYESIVSTRRDGKNQLNNAQRYRRIAFEILDEYLTKDNRKNKKWRCKEIDDKLTEVIKSIRDKKNDEAYKKLHHLLDFISERFTL